MQNVTIPRLNDELSVQEGQRRGRIRRQELHECPMPLSPLPPPNGRGQWCRTNNVTICLAAQRIDSIRLTRLARPSKSHYVPKWRTGNCRLKIDKNGKTINERQNRKPKGKTAICTQCGKLSENSDSDRAAAAAVGIVKFVISSFCEYKRTSRLANGRILNIYSGFY